MKVFINRATGDYCGGLCIIAANSESEAHETLFATYENNPAKEYFRWYHEEIYKKENWKVLLNVECDTKVPMLLAEDSYME